MRLDVYLCKEGFFESRTRAKKAIDENRVSIDGKIASKPSEEVNEGNVVEVAESHDDRLVGRAGLKLEYALDSFGIDVNGMRAVDIGASTGGFTQALLEHGAIKVYAVDVGRNQLHNSLRTDKRVVSIEEFNARNLDLSTVDGVKVDFACMDVSFISQTLLYDGLNRVLKDGGIFVSLIKPQFELTKADLGKNGIVKDEKKRKTAVDNVLNQASLCGFELLNISESPIKGGSGNTEYIASFRKGHK